MPPSLGEFDIIARFFAPLAGDSPGALGLLDDAALIDPGPGQTLVITTDALVAGVHFPLDAEPEQAAAKALGVNLSDLAAMGARPIAYLLTAALPKAWSSAELERWLSRFTARLALDQRRYKVSLIGGDTVATPGPLGLSITAVGAVAAGRALLRSGARVDDDVYVSGTIGDAALGLRVIDGDFLDLHPADRADLLERYHTPRPRVDLGARLHGVATAAADVSDGLVADLGHVCLASGVAAVIDVERVPLSSAASAAIADDTARLASAICGGDDYELVFTAPASARAAISTLACDIDLPLTMVGRIEAWTGEPGRVRVLSRGRSMAVSGLGWRHFR